MVDYLLHFPHHLSARMHFLCFAADLLAGRLKLKLTTVASLQQGMDWAGLDWAGLAGLGHWYLVPGVNSRMVGLAGLVERLG